MCYVYALDSGFWSSYPTTLIHRNSRELRKLDPFQSITISRPFFHPIRFTWCNLQQEGNPLRVFWYSASCVVGCLSPSHVFFSTCVSSSRMMYDVWRCQKCLHLRFFRHFRDRCIVSIRRYSSIMTVSSEINWQFYNE